MSNSRMLINRRNLLNTALALAGSSSISAIAQPSGSTTPFPAEQQLEPGDFLWPKSPGAFVPYNSEGGLDYDNEKRAWIASKKKYIAAIKANAAASPQQRKLAQALEDMEFREFQSLYLGDIPPYQPDHYGGDQLLYVGHIAIVENRGSGVQVIEALMGKGVVRGSYAAWIESRKGQIVWHARVKDRPVADRAGISSAAAEHLGKPYDFWDFNLNNTSGFYCSKLVWNSVMRSLGVSLDDNQDADRSFWYSPKQVMKSKHIYFLNNPGSYTWK